ncbi:bifunctional phosphoribosyl-AMP cyclohydrolase/phosphoribosyl-ATP diphosphatase HisIE [Photobacterium carnosum]|uniref:bifunctional phosphoribosyl-AMP cyclohydrolase/phosphoribosyl-ATP diphosphatase HisIE n=1 Tax=Photobacterium carnosum TaxID=2023717 RepID=UPI001E30D2EB|nr:bifunctional phosphoribosyl-AMP cyclohydrolase/phosphoribosyl-ATP diphosphatase HisIE [Photobacterium carnosum]MCD9524928.1 bifunctional phosphoribosyl-AMP cyclohydrolase/phosphoribosyl-ATP diphosphatase HisIE [Photobacterium carnosum]
MSLTTSIDWEKVTGLIPAIIQDNNSGQVLMLGYMNDEALAKTLATEHVTFWSRTKNRLWTKGETSGNVLHLKSIKLDCDQDTLLVQVDPMGPTCHLNTTSCFGNDDTTNTQPALVFLHQLEQILADRRGADPDSSYTASLYARGTKRISQKVGEEGVEVALAATSGDKAELVCESADLIYHLLVLLQNQNLTLEDVINKLKQRHQQ